MNLIDLRSDTITRPVPAMRLAMANAEVGDDVWGEDPTVNRLEAIVAEMFGRDAAVFACSGTQSNQMGLRVHCQPGDELLIHETGHICNFEGGAPAALSGVTVRTLPGSHGMLDIDQLEGKVRLNDQHFCRTRLVCLENTTNLGGGCVYPGDQLARVSEWAISNQLRRHLDGARLFNALVESDYSARDVGQWFDTISICFSKGLGCPAGSMLIGDAEEIARARRIRKLFGGAMRQSGILAAAALYALEHHIHRLTDDHANARRLADGLRTIPGICDVPETVHTNILFFRIAPSCGTAVQFAAAMKQHGILIGPMGGQNVRAVTHLDVTAQNMESVIAAARSCFQNGFADQALTGKGPFAR